MVCNFQKNVSNEFAGDNFWFLNWVYWNLSLLLTTQFTLSHHCLTYNHFSRTGIYDNGICHVVITTQQQPHMDGDSFDSSSQYDIRSSNYTQPWPRNSHRFIKTRLCYLYYMSSDSRETVYLLKRGTECLTNIAWLRYGISHYKDKKVSRPTYLHNRNFRTWKDGICIERRTDMFCW